MGIPNIIKRVFIGSDSYSSYSIINLCSSQLAQWFYGWDRAFTPLASLAPHFLYQGFPQLPIFIIILGNHRKPSMNQKSLIFGYTTQRVELDQGKNLGFSNRSPPLLLIPPLLWLAFGRIHLVNLLSNVLSLTQHLSEVKEKVAQFKEDGFSGTRF